MLKNQYDHEVNKQCTGNYYTFKPLYKGQSREPGNVFFMSSCPLCTG